MYKTGIWTSDEDNILLTLGPSKTCKELVGILNRSSSSIYHHAKELNIKLKKETRDAEWTKDEIKTLKQLGSTHTGYQLSNILNRTENSICNMASKLEIKLKEKETNNIWTEEEIKTLKTLIDKKTIKEISGLVNRSENAVYRQALKLGLINNTWDDEKYNQLKSLIGKLPIKQIAEEMECSVATINRKIKLIKEGKELTTIKKETKQEKDNVVNTSSNNDPYIDEIKKLGQKFPCEVIADILGVEKKDIYYISEKNNIHIISKYEYIKKLIKEYITLNPDFTIDELSENFSKSSRRIYDILKEIDVEYKASKFWDEEQQEFLHQQWGTKSIEKISKETGKTITAIRTKAQRLNLGSMLKNSEKLPISMIADLLNVNKSTIVKCWVKKGLKISRIHLTTKTSYMVTTLKNLYSFLENNQDLWNSNNLEKYILGKEPEWLKIKRKLDILNINGKPLSINEMEQLKLLLLENKSLIEISKILKRPISDISKIINELQFNGNIKYFFNADEITQLNEKKLLLQNNL